MLQVIADPITWYGVAAVVYAGLGIQVFMPGMGSLLRMQRLLLAAAGLAWALYFGLADRLTGLDPVLASDLAFSLDFGLLLAWFALLSRLLRGPYKQSMPETVRRGLYLFWGLIALASVVGLWLSDISNLGATILAAMLLAAALACLAMVTQLHRDSPVEDRAAMRAFVAAGVLLALNVPTVVPFLEQLLGFQVMPGDVYYVTAIPSVLETEDVTIIAIAAFILTSLATLYPARRAAAVNPAVALRYE